MGRARWQGFYFITDGRLTENGIVEDVRQAISAGSVMVQYREKDKPWSERRTDAVEVQNLCREAGVVFIVNDDVDLARDIGADGVHVGQEDTPPGEARRVLGPEAVIGVSVGSADEARRAEAAGASYLAVSPVFSTDTKLDAGPGVGIDGVRAIREVTRLPLAAIGGLNRDNIPAVLEAGADLICAISASLAGGRVTENIRELMGQGAG